MRNSCAIQPYMMKGYREVENSSTTVVNGGEPSTTGHDKFTSCEEAPGLQRRSERFEKTKKKSCAY